MTNGGISDKLQIFEEATYDAGSGTETIFGKTTNFSWNLEASVEPNFDLTSDGAQPSFNIDGVTSVTGTHDWELTDGRELKAIFGSLPVNTGGNFTLDVAKGLPSYTIKAINDYNEDDNVIISGIKYTEATLSMNRDEPITISASWIGRRLLPTGAFTPAINTREPLMYLDGAFLVSGVAQSGVESASISINRNIVPRRYIESTTSNQRRWITKLIEGVLNLTVEGSQEAKQSVIERIWGGATMQDVRASIPLVLQAQQGVRKLNLNISGAKYTSVARTLDKTQEVALNEFTAVALDIAGTGSYSGA